MPTIKKHKPWLSNSRPKQLIQVGNVKAKINKYKDDLPLTDPEEMKIITVCDGIIATITYSDQIRATAKQATEVVDMILDGEDDSDPANKSYKQTPPATPVFGELVLPAGATTYLIKQFREMMDDVKHKPGYTHDIGEDLMIEPADAGDISTDDLTAEGKVTALADTGKVRIAGSLQGMNAMRVEWKAKGAAKFLFVGQLDKLPGDVEIPAEELPVSGEIRLFLIEKNEQVGNPSPNYPVTVS